MLETAMNYSHTLLRECIEEGDFVVDATMGNGHDTLFLSQCVGENGHVLAFDVQQQAIQQTEKRLDEHHRHNVRCILDGHEHLSHYLDKNESIKAAIFNLGYLPKSDKHIITHASTTIEALQVLINHLVPSGRIVLVLYYGHEGGNEEKEAVLSFSQQLDQKQYNVLTYQFINQRNAPPICLCIEKKF